MRSSSALRSEISQLLRLLLDADVALYINPVRRINTYKGVTRVTWDGGCNLPGAIFRGDFATIAAYWEWVEANAFSAILFDGALLQITYDFLGQDLIGHRLLYCPCPYDLDNDLLRAEPVLDVVSMYKEKDETMVRLRSALRFDYHKGATEEPAVHMTLFWKHSRWAIVAPISPGHFIRFIFRQFYPVLWRAHEFLRNWPQQLGDRTITKEEESLLHITCLR